MKPLRLAMVARRFWPLAGRRSRTLARLAVGLAERRCRATILTARWQPRWPEQICWHGLPVVRLSPPPQGRWQTWRTCGRWPAGCGRRDQFDLVYVWRLEHEAAAAVEALRPGRSAGDHGRPGRSCCAPHGPAGRRLLPADRVSRRAEDQRVMPAGRCRWWRRRRWSAASWRPPDIRAGGFARSRWASSALRADRRVPAAARHLLAEANAALRLTPRETLAVSTVRLAAGRGWEHLIAAWPAIARRCPHARLWLAGEAPDLAAARQQIESLGLGPQVLVAGVFDELDVLLGAADLAVVPAVDGLPLALLEAMAAGLPIVATDVPEHRHLAADSQEALLVPPADAVALAAAVGRILADPALAARLARAAQARATRDFSLARMVQGHVTLFEHLMGVRLALPRPPDRSRPDPVIIGFRSRRPAEFRDGFHSVRVRYGTTEERSTGGSGPFRSPPEASREAKAGPGKALRRQRALFIPRFLREAAANLQLKERGAGSGLSKSRVRWADLETSGHLPQYKETSIDTQFLDQLFGEGLGLSGQDDQPGRLAAGTQVLRPGHRDGRRGARRVPEIASAHGRGRTQGRHDRPGPRPLQRPHRGPAMLGLSQRPAGVSVGNRLQFPHDPPVSPRKGDAVLRRILAPGTARPRPLRRVLLPVRAGRAPAFPHRPTAPRASNCCARPPIARKASATICTESTNGGGWN